jgi:hypothetical protein
MEPGWMIVVLTGAASSIPREWQPSNWTISGLPRLNLTIPGMPRPELDPSHGVPCPELHSELIFAIAVPPLLLSATMVGWLARRLRFDLVAEHAEKERLRSIGRQVVAEAATEPVTGGAFGAQRLALGRAVRERRLTEDVARDLIKEIDLRRTARHTGPSAG